MKAQLFTKVQKHLLYVFSFLFLLSCIDQTIDQHRQKVNIYRFDLSGELSAIDTSFLEKKINDESTEYWYHMYNNADSMGLYYHSQIKINEDLNLQYMGAPCEFQETKTYTIDHNEYDVYIYYYDLENSADEESMIYFTESFGIIMIYSYGWLCMEAIIEYDEASEQLIDAIINDTLNDFPLFERRRLNNY